MTLLRKTAQLMEDMHSLRILKHCDETNCSFDADGSMILRINFDDDLPKEGKIQSLTQIFKQEFTEKEILNHCKFGNGFLLKVQQLKE